MKAYIHRDWARDGVDVFLYEDYQNARRPYSFKDGRFKPGEAVPQGAELSPTFFFDNHIYEALRQAMIGEAIEKDDALADTRRVRDRLLTLVEHAHNKIIG